MERMLDVNILSHDPSEREIIGQRVLLKRIRTPFTKKKNNRANIIVVRFVNQIN